MDLYEYPIEDEHLELITNTFDFISTHSMALQTESTYLKFELEKTHAQIVTLASSKVKIFADPGKFNKKYETFEAWWSKMQAWLALYSGDIHPGSYDSVVTVLLKLTESYVVVLEYPRTELGMLYTWDDFLTKISSKRSSNLQNLFVSLANQVSSNNPPSNQELYE